MNDSNEMYFIILNCERNSLTVATEERKSKRIRNAEGGLQMFTKLVCEKLESEKQMSNSDVRLFLNNHLDCRNFSTRAFNWRS